jgi:hypothetical protein
MDLSDDATGDPATWISAELGTAMASAGASEPPPNRSRQRSAPRFPLDGQLPKHAHQPTAGLKCSVTQYGELLGRHLTASLNLREVGPVVGDAVGQLLLLQPGFPAPAPELLTEADGKQPDRLRVERVRCGLLSLGGVGRWVTLCGVSPTWNRTGCHVTRL